MNLTKSKVILKKINTLHDNIEMTGDMSKIEKDLFLDYIKDLYELVLEEKESTSKKKKKEKKSAAIPEVVKAKKEIIYDSFETADDPELDLIEDQEIAKEVKEVRRAESAKPAPAEVIHQSMPQSSPTPSAPLKNINPEIEALFNDDSLHQNAYRFSQTAITDVTKAMGINERILTVNLLFNKDQADFNYIATKLNYFSSFEEASTYLKTEVAEKYNWAEETKRSKALDFINLVKRKYTA